MEQMKALIFHKPGSISVEEIPVPQPGPGDMLLRVHATSICASDLRVYRGEKYAKSGVIPGHEIAGEVAEVGRDVEGFTPGERVTVCPILACGQCYFCLRGKRNRCVHRVTLGYDENGGLAHYLLLPEQLVKLGHVIKVGPEMPFELAAMTEPFACALNSVETCRVQPGGTLLIMGAGPMGLIHLIIAKAMGCAQIVVSDLLPERLKVARSLGATHTVQAQQGDLKEAVMEATNGLGADAAVLTVGIASSEVVAQGLGLVRKQGFLNLFAGFPPGTSIQIDPNLIHYNEVFLTGTQNATPDHYQRASRLLSVVPEAVQLITHRFPAHEADKAYEARLALDGLKSVVLY